MKTRWIALSMAAAMALSLVGCGGDTSSAGTSESTSTSTATAETQSSAETSGKPTASGKTLIVGTMANSLGLPVHQAEIAGYFEEAGLDV